MIEAEEWRAVVGWEGLYEVSNRGRVRSLSRLVRSRYGGFRRTRLKALRSTTGKAGYPKVVLCSGGTLTDKSVHALVAEVFLGKRPSASHNVNHRDGVKDNNDSDNLEWCTRSENSLHSCRVLGNCRGSSHGRSKLTEAEVIEMRRLKRSGLRRADIAERFGVRACTVDDITQGRSWRHVS